MDYIYFMLSDLQVSYTCKYTYTCNILTYNNMYTLKFKIHYKNYKYKYRNLR